MDTSKNNEKATRVNKKEKDVQDKVKLEVKEADDPKGTELSGIPGTGGEDKSLGNPAAGAGAAGTAGRGTSNKKRLD